MARKDTPNDVILKGVAAKFIDESEKIYGISNDGNRINVITRTKGEAIAEGIIAGTRPIIIGKQDSISNTLEDLTELDVDVTPVPASAIPMELVSDAITDNSAGIGARTVKVYGLDTDFNEQSETVIMDGTTPVDLVNLYIRINAMHVLTNGVIGGTADGLISLKADGAGTEYIRISAGGNMSRQCHFTIPNDAFGYINGWSAGLKSNNTDTIGVAILRATVEWGSRELQAGVFLFQDIILGESPSIPKITNPIVLPAKCDVKISVQKVTGAGDLSASGSIDLSYA